MTKRNYKLYVKDILDAIEKIEEYTKNLSFEKFSDNKLVIDAVVRNFEIIGEASKNIPGQIKTLHQNIPWKEMAGMRDKIIHEYFGVDLDIVWKTIETRLPNLRTSLRDIYESTAES
ncbi:MAG: DUF86 domain-containing protein [Candidatus Omnitrophota bacterium]